MLEQAEGVSVCGFEDAIGKVDAWFDDDGRVHPDVPVCFVMPPGQHFRYFGFEPRMHCIFSAWKVFVVVINEFAMVFRSQFLLPRLFPAELSADNAEFHSTLVLNNESLLKHVCSKGVGFRRLSIVGRTPHSLAFSVHLQELFRSFACTSLPLSIDKKLMFH